MVITGDLVRIWSLTFANIATLPVLMADIRKILTVSQFAERCPAFTESALRWVIFNRHKNGLAESGAILRNGRRILIDADKFFAWLETR